MTDAVLLSCHGTVTHMQDVPAFLSNIRRGRPAPPELVEEVIRRYELIGGSPLMEGSRAQAEALEARLGIPVRVAGRLWHPYPSEVLGALADLGARRVLSLPLAPQSVDVYNAAVAEAAGGVSSIELLRAPAWGLEPALIDAYLETIADGLDTSARAWGSSIVPDRTPIILSAHSLPVRIVEQGDPYERDFRAMAERVAAPLRERGHPVEIGFQSQGATSDRWLGPDLAGLMEALRARGFDRVFVAPIGFVAEHIETLYDLDVDAPELARARGLAHFGRAPTVAARPRFIDALEAVSRRALV